jgi:putative spermidine/putrescine transport system ATP-binding protein
MAKIELRNLAHSYGGNPSGPEDYALRRMDHVWEDGGAYALLGPSGCGKTTLLNIISGLVQPSEGQVLFDGQEVNALPTERRNVAQVFQFPVLYDTMSVYDNLAFPLRNRRVPEDRVRERVEEIATMLDLGDVLKRRAVNLGADAKQKISVGRGLVRSDVAAVLFDEPLTVIDPHLKWRLRRKLKEIHERLKLTLVYVTHDQTEALTMSDRVAVFNDGRIQQVAAPDELYESPQNSFVAQFIGENNTMEGTIKEIKGGNAVVQLDNGELIDAKPVNVEKAGDRTLISIRPERVEFNRERLNPDAHTLQAEVLEFIYMGDIFRTRLRVAGSDEFIIKTRNAPDQRRLKPGEKIEIGWMPDDCRALDAR